MVEEILSTAQLHRYLLEVPQSDDIEVRYNSNSMRKISAIKKLRVSRGKVSHTDRFSNQ